MGEPPLGSSVLPALPGVAGCSLAPLKLWCMDGDILVLQEKCLPCVPSRLEQLASGAAWVSLGELEPPSGSWAGSCNHCSRMTCHFVRYCGSGTPSLRLIMVWVGAICMHLGGVGAVGFGQDYYMLVHRQC
jgi:hypothetical protein